ncbi:hypothetical protein NHX12_011834 [Muraenolepis orangiensis]|uniref:Uncharacterized protein n=1 Tax=Muraenolepis orangiensis TaxID=630683 RepID=A0A9Q0DGL4_9TELE|nr:hypothetical protein NHX12_011834 [Muraenolepis orangiensis]
MDTVSPPQPEVTPPLAVWRIALEGHGEVHTLSLCTLQRFTHHKYGKTEANPPGDHFIAKAPPSWPCTKSALSKTRNLWTVLRF